MAPQARPVRRKDGTLRWRVQFRERPGTTPTSESFDTPEHAERFIAHAEMYGWTEARRLRDGMTARDHKIPTLATWFDEHLEQLAASVTPGTIDGYRSEAARTWLPRLGRIPLDMLTREQVTHWVAWQRRQETQRSARARAKAAAAGKPLPPAQLVAPKTISNAQRLLSSVLASAAERYGTGNVARGVPLPSDAVGHEMAFLTRDEYARIYHAADPAWRPLIAFLAGTGARWGEATALTRDDFDLDGEIPQVRIWRAWKRGANGGVYLGSPKSRRGVRTVSLSPTAIAAIRDTVEATSPGQLVFRSVRGSRIRHQNFHPRVWLPAITASGISKQPRVHDLRHSHASWLIHEGVPLPILQRRLGHESIKTTVDRYGHILPDADRATAAAVERAMGDFDPTLALTGELMPPPEPE